VKEKLASKLQAFNQGHLLAFWDQLDATGRANLAEQIAGIDFAMVNRLYAHRGSPVDWVARSERAESPPAVRPDSDEKNSYAETEARNRGEEALRAGQVAALLVAGGQGTRLGHEGPKGTFEIGPVSGASLYQILFEKVLATSRRYEVRVPLFLMTSPATDRPTRAYLAEHDNFGLPDEDLVIFCQGTMPAVDRQSGRILLAAPGEIALSPDGHGGTLAALHKSGALATMAERGIKQLSYFQVDNPLAPVCDPVKIGYHLLSGSELSTLVVAKQTPEDRVGNVVAVDGSLQIIEYSDLPPAAAQRRRGDHSLELWAGNTAIHIFEVDFLARMAASEESLPFHIAEKAVPHIDQQGRLQQPRDKNALKFERFIFDLLPKAKDALVIEVRAAEAFAPVKNASGAEKDTPESTQAAMIAEHTRWLTAAGAQVQQDVAVEISPLYALDAGQLAAKIQPGLVLREPTYLR